MRNERKVVNARTLPWFGQCSWKEKYFRNLACTTSKKDPSWFTINRFRLPSIRVSHKRRATAALLHSAAAAHRCDQSFRSNGRLFGDNNVVRVQLRLLSIVFVVGIDRKRLKNKKWLMKKNKLKFWWLTSVKMVYSYAGWYFSWKKKIILKKLWQTKILLPYPRVSPLSLGPFYSSDQHLLSENKNKIIGWNVKNDNSLTLKTFTWAYDECNCFGSTSSPYK